MAARVHLHADSQRLADLGTRVAGRTPHRPVAPTRSWLLRRPRQRRNSRKEDSMNAKNKAASLVEDILSHPRSIYSYDRSGCHKSACYLVFRHGYVFARFIASSWSVSSLLLGV